MRGTPTRYSVGISIDSHNGHHVDYRLFEKIILLEYEDINVTRALSATGRTGSEEFIEYIKRLKPHIIFVKEDVMPLPSQLIHNMGLLGYKWVEPEYGSAGYVLNG